MHALDHVDGHAVADGVEVDVLVVLENFALEDEPLPVDVDAGLVADFTLQLRHGI